MDAQTANNTYYTDMKRLAEEKDMVHVEVEIKDRLDPGNMIYTYQVPDNLKGYSPEQLLVVALEAAAKEGADLQWADLRWVNLRGANLPGANLQGADLAGADLTFADLRHSSLADANLEGAILAGVNLGRANSEGANLRSADLTGACLHGANLRDTNLTGAVLIHALLDDEHASVIIPDIHKRVYAAAVIPGALDMNEWHSHCGTAHCRAGWVITLAGDEGREMEEALGTPTAAALIYQASDPSLERIPNFYVTNDEALADMKRLAEGGAQ